jgi:hypothetical protein
MVKRLEIMECLQKFLTSQAQFSSSRWNNYQVYDPNKELEAYVSLVFFAINRFFNCYI